MNNTTSKYPIDFDAVRKGDEFTPERLADILGKQPSNDAFRFAVLGLQVLIQERTGLTVKGTPEGGLRVLVDSEAAEHNRRLFSQNMRALGTRHALNCQVDVDNLSPEQRAKHDRTLLTQSRYVSAIVSTTRSMSLKGSAVAAIEPATEENSAESEEANPR